MATSVAQKVVNQAAKTATATTNGTNEPTKPDTEKKPPSLSTLVTRAKNKLAKLEKEREVFNEQVLPILEAQDIAVSKGAKLTKTQEVARDKNRKRQTELEKEIATAEAELAETEEKKAAEDKEKAAQKALKKATPAEDDRPIEHFEMRALTPKENKIVTAIEEDMQDAWNNVQSEGLRFAQGLERIKKEKLYVAYEGGFKGYCLTRWGIDVTNANRQIGFAQMVRSIEGVALELPRLDIDEEPKPVLDPNVLPKNVGQYREIQRAGSQDNQLKLWARCTELAKEGTNITAAVIRTTLDSMFESGEIENGMDAAIPDGGNKGSLAAKAKREEATAGPLSPDTWRRFATQRYKGIKYTIEELRHPEGKSYKCFVDNNPLSDGEHGTWANAVAACQAHAKSLDAETEAEFEAVVHTTQVDEAEDTSEEDTTTEDETEEAEDEETVEVVGVADDDEDSLFEE
jgi:hypothetical protein